MINLFRNIRQNLLKQNRISKYAMYAVGEIFLVMIGILLALQFNNWNTEKSNQVKEVWYLNNIAEDMEYQRASLLDMKTLYTKSIKHGKSILRSYNQYKNFRKIDSFNEKLNVLSISQSFPNINNAYREMISSGQLSLIEDKELSTDIIDYYLFSEDCDLDITNDIENVFYKEIYPVISNLSQVSLTSLEMDLDDENLLDVDTELERHIFKKLENLDVKLSFLNAVKTNILIQDYHLIMVEETLDIMDSLIVKIDTQLILLQD